MDLLELHHFCRFEVVHLPVSLPFFHFCLRDSRGGMAEGSTMMLEPRTSSMTRMTETIDDTIRLGSGDLRSPAIALFGRSHMSKNVTITSGQKQH